MFHLIKLGLYLIAGYAIYEFMLGITENRTPQTPKKAPSAPNRSGQQTNGLRGGRRVPVADGSGAERSQVVGRGVLS